MSKFIKNSKLLPFIFALSSSAMLTCGSDGNGLGEGNGGSGDSSTSDVEQLDEWDQALLTRDVDFNAALRSAALKLTGNLPSLAEIEAVAGGVDEAAQKAQFEATVADYIERPEFSRQMFYWWRDVFRTGGNGNLEQAAAFAARISVEDTSMTELFTATNGTCTSIDRGSNTFDANDCNNGVPQHSGVLTHPAVMSHFFGNMAFRRVRWVQETFDCLAFPAEIGEAQDVGGVAPYNGIWPFESISGEETGRVDFLDVQGVICADCHQSMNHIAPLFANFDEDGNWSDNISVPLPTDGAPTAELRDWLPAGETTAWRFGVEAADLPALGQILASDERVAECTVARVWNWALSKGDIVDALETVPSDVISTQVDAYTSGGQRMKSLIFDVFTSEDFYTY